MGSDSNKPAKRFYRKRVELFRLIEKIKLWPSRTGVLHGIRSIEHRGDTAVITTHCNRSFTANDSRNSRAARWLRNKLFICACSACRIPDWKLEKYNSTRFHRHFGSALKSDDKPKLANG
jgi:pyrrolysyl-tRNA synthetase-like protein